MISIKNWSKYQSYKDRKPPWIRFHRAILDDYEYQSMSAESRALLPMLWLLACEDEDPTSGRISVETKVIAFRLRMDIAVLETSIKEIQAADFIECIESVTESLRECNYAVNKETYDCNEIVTPETETETKTEKHLSESVDSDDFEQFWELYPRKDSKKKAAMAWKRLPKYKREKAIQDIRTRYAGVERQFIPIPTTYINGERWEDSPIPRQGAVEPSALPWHETSSGIIAKGKELNIFESDYDMFPDFKAAVLRAAGRI